MYDLNTNGLATVAVDQLNRISQFTYDRKGNMTEETYPDGNISSVTYNSFSEPLTYIDENDNDISLHLR